MNYKLLGLAARAMPHPLRKYFVGKLVARPQRLPVTKNEFMENATPIKFGRQKTKVAWILGEGPLVICIHGWGGTGAADMGHIAGRLVTSGFRVIALDLTGHGASPGNEIGFGIFIDDIAEFSAGLLEPVHSYVGFSAGGLCTMAVRAQGGLSAKKFVCISSPCEPYPPINLLKSKLGMGEKLLNEMRRDIASHFNCSWDNITHRCFSADSNEELLLVYDIQDNFIRHEDADRIAHAWGGAIVVKTEGNKHRDMLGADAVIRAVCDFICR